MLIPPRLSSSPRRQEAPLARSSPPRVNTPPEGTRTPNAGGSAKALSAKRYAKFLKFRERAHTRKVEAKGSSPSAPGTARTEASPPLRPPTASAGNRIGATRSPTLLLRRRVALRNPLAEVKDFRPSDPPANVGRSSSPQRATTGNPLKRWKKQGKGKGKSKEKKGEEGSQSRRD